MAFPYHHVLMIGATAGIGRSMTDRIVESGSRVIVVGRRQERLDEIVTKYGKDKVTAAQFDIGKLEEIPSFVKSITKAHPDIDCIFLNAGTQTHIDLTQAASLKFSDFTKEMDVNFSSFVSFTYEFIPFLNKIPNSSLIYTSSNIAIIPASWIPAYSASKAALNAFILCLRMQMKNKSTKIIEVSPPPVQTELHDEQMGKEAGRKFGMPVDQFVNQTFDQILAGSDQVVVGAIGPDDVFNNIIKNRRDIAEDLDVKFAAAMSAQK